MRRESKLKNTLKDCYEFYENGDLYKILILGRGEELFFQKNDYALVCEISASHSLINIKTIKRWDNGNLIDESEKIELLAEIKKIYKLAYRDDLYIFV